MLKTLLRFLMVIALLSLIACNKSDEQQQEDEDDDILSQITQDDDDKAGNSGSGEPQDFAQAMNQMQQMLSGGDKVDPIHFRDLMALLPKKLAGMKGSKPIGEKSGAFGMKVSHAEITHRGDDGVRLRVKITDLGTMKGLAAMGAYAWAMAEIDRETERGYERTVTYKGHKGIEKFDEQSKKGELNYIVAERFAVELEGWNMKMDRIKAARDEIDFGKLKEMKNVGVE